jgi:hypothetical protein
MVDPLMKPAKPAGTATLRGRGGLVITYLGDALRGVLVLLLWAAAGASRAATPVPDDILQSAIAEAARGQGVDTGSITVVKAEAVTWPDGSLGCPKPGMAYTQALVPGYRIRLRAKGTLLDYHASDRGKLVLCPAGRSAKPLPEEKS